MRNLRRRIFQGVFGKSNSPVERSTRLLTQSPSHKTRQIATTRDVYRAFLRHRGRSLLGRSINEGKTTATSGLTLSLPILLRLCSAPA